MGTPSTIHKKYEPRRIDPDTRALKVTKVGAIPIGELRSMDTGVWVRGEGRCCFVTTVLTLFRAVGEGVMGAAGHVAGDPAVL